MNTGGPRLFVSGDRVIGAVGDLVRAADCEFALLRAVDAALGNLPGTRDAAANLVRAVDVSPELLRHFGDGSIHIPTPDPVDATTLTEAAARTTDALRAGAEAIAGAVFFDGRFVCQADLLVRDGARYVVHSAVAPARVGALGDEPRHDDGGPSDIGLPRRSRGNDDAQDRDVDGESLGDRGAEADRDADSGVSPVLAESRSGAAGFVDADDHRVLRRELAAGRTPFERVSASVRSVGVDPVRLELCARVEVAACVEALAAAGVDVDPVARISTPTGEQGVIAAELEPIYRARRARVEHVVEEKLTELLPVQWGDPRYLACGQCPTCRAAAATARDLLLVAGIRPTQRARLREAGVLTIDRLAATTVPVPGLAPRTVTELRRQADIQLTRERTATPTYALRDATALGALPTPRPGDLALLIDLDRRGTITSVELADATTTVFRPDPSPTDPRYAQASDYGSFARNGGLGSDEGNGGALGAFARGAGGLGTSATGGGELGPSTQDGYGPDVLEELLDIIGEYRALDPDVRVYHYGSAVRTALLDWSGRFGVGADQLDELLADGALVDLAPVVRTALLIGEQSYDVAGLAALVPGAHGRAATVLGIRDWLLERAAEAGIEVPGPRFAVVETDIPPSLRTGSLEAALAEFAADAHGDAARAAALTAAVLGYHRRERQPRWWAHIDRLGHPVGEWADAPGVLVAEWGTVDTKWHRTPQLPTMRRYLTLTGRLGTGATLTPGTQMITIYDGAAAAGMTQTLGRRATATATVLGCAVDADFDDTVRLEELLPAGCPPYDDLPAAIAPGPPDGEADLEAALEATAQDLLVTLPSVPANAVYDLLLRRPPRLHEGAPLPQVDGDIAHAMAQATAALDASYLAVHGPPGTGKTGTTARAIERLVTRKRWRIGVVARSHEVIERIFDAVVEAGLLPELVAKKDVASVGREWSAIEGSRYPRFLDNAVNGCVIGGTTADFVDETLIAPGSLDLLVIADAGECSLADTVAVAVSARNLLLVGDPEPALAQAEHPEPIHVSALEWLCDGAATLPPEYGYFLDRTWRMHPAVCVPVSVSCYDGKLTAVEAVTRARDLAGIAPGVSTVFVEHRGSATESDAEAREVVRRVRALLGETWTSGARTRKLHPHDVFVVAPYAAQVARIRTLLARAKIEDVLVGTPDRFRGREAAVVVLSMTTSTPDDAPFGMRALLSRTVIHATLCRAMWKAIIIRSPLLTEYLPDTPEELAALRGFLQLG
ncbi:AAA domain-containing protein [Nocardia sp. JW2]|uniref:bifunctional RecB family nuclease/DEAD/DEAH box helicase n=1 Tax=Nocardia sp. JW2 TaxID=3450738 RepID=UPI003F41CAFD